MQDLLPLAGILAALTVGVMSPGPSFVMVARVAVARSRRAGLAAALGMGLGGALFAVAALAGLQALFVAVPTLYLGLKVLGGLYLAWIGWCIWRGAHEPLGVHAESAAGADSTAQALWLGLATQVSNPKTAIVYASVFAAFLPAQWGLGFAAALVLAAFAVETAWYALVAVALSAPAPRAAYLRWKAWVDRLAGGVMIALGLRLASSFERA